MMRPERRGEDLSIIMVCVIAMWILLQLLVVWLGARAAGARQLYRDDYLALEAGIACYRAPTGVCSSVTVSCLRALEESPAHPLRATGSLDAAADPMAAACSGRT